MKKKMSAKMRTDMITGHLFLLPQYILILVFVVIPIIYAVYLSLCKYNGFSEMHFIGLENYRNLFQDTKFFTAMRNSLVYAALTVPTLVISALAISAVLASKFRNGFGQTTRIILYLPTMVSLILVGSIFFFVFASNEDGLVNTVLGWFGMEPQNWLGQRSTAMPVVAFVFLWRSLPTLKKILADKVRRYAEKGMEGRALRAMIVGIPNVGKSSLVNRLGGGKKARVEDRPGVTLTKQWVTTSVGIELLDMPGVLWPKFDDRETGERLAYTGAIRDAILDTEELASALCRDLYREHRDLFCTRYKLDADALADASPYDLLCAVARKRGFLISGGELDTSRAADILLDEFREAKIGRITLELP